ncbi:hypothetical protein GF382_00300 [Candidatus Falkowbacteria bacterium]|nr:hypothetical protein [Candidatus Falkowbacteria bacterium]
MFDDFFSWAGVIGVLTLVVGILVKVIGFPDQIRKNYKRRSTEGLSAWMIVLTFIAYVLWTIHGVMQNDMVLVFGQGIGIITTGVIIYQILVYKNKK